MHRPVDHGYPTVGFNVAVDRRPWAVIDAHDAGDVVAAVGFAGANDMTVAVHATGHGAVTVDGTSLLVRTSGMTAIEIDPRERTARVGAGVRWQQVLEAAAPHGLAPLCGSAPSVGVIGFLTGGGIGPLVRAVGCSSDHVREFEVVTGDGRLVHASPSENAELFWGLRGGKATLGVVTEAVIDLLPIATLYAGAMYFDAADAEVVLRRWRAWTDTLPDDADTSVAVMRLPDLPGVPAPLAGRTTVAVRYAALTTPERAEAVLAPIRAAADPILDTVGTMPYAAIGAVHADPVDPMPVVEGGVLLRDLSDGVVDEILRHAGPDVRTGLAVVEIRLLGGRFAQAPRVDSAVCHRDAVAHLYAVGVLAPEAADIAAGQVSALVASMADYSDGRRLPNFSASSDQAVIAACYDEETRSWLSALAVRFDRRGVLRAGQVVR
ncbi:FAD-binding oxidoreductase [Gordonia humi]